MTIGAKDIAGFTTRALVPYTIEVTGCLEKIDRGLIIVSNYVDKSVIAFFSSYYCASTGVTKWCIEIYTDPEG